MTGKQPQADGPFATVKVIELQGLGPTPYGTMLLADLGADVIRIDRPPSESQSTHAPRDRTDVFGRGKRSVALDLKQPEDLAVAQALIDTADVIVDPYRPGVAERLGIGPNECITRNPGLVFARMTGWGQTGPMAQAVGHDINYIALTGALQPLGEPGRPPAIPLNYLGDYAGGGLLLAFGVAAALLEREHSGRGQIIDVAMMDGIASLMTIISRELGAGRWRFARASHWLDGSAPWYRAYRTADDRYVTVGALEPHFYRDLVTTIGLDVEQWPQWDQPRWPALNEVMEQIFSQRTLADWCATLEGTNSCFAPVLDMEEAAAHPHAVARETFVRRDGILQPAPSPRFSRTPGAIRGGPPLPGEHTEAVLSELAKVSTRRKDAEP